MNLETIILAAGKGTRMNSDKPKVLHDIAGKPMLQHVIDTAMHLNPVSQHVVIGFGGDQISTHFAQAGKSYNSLQWVEQTEQLGTGHAVQQAVPNLEKAQDGIALILYGDVPLTSQKTLKELLDVANENTVAILTLETDMPQGLGRILRDHSGSVMAIVEEKDANEEQKKISEINTGIMAVPIAKLEQWLGRLENNNAQGEFYLTDIIEMAVNEGTSVNTKVIQDSFEVLGVNDKAQLSVLEKHFQTMQRQKLLAKGVTLLDADRVYIRGNIEVGKDVSIDANVILEGNVSLGHGVSIGANVRIKNSSIGEGTNILDGCNLDSAEIGKVCNIGPMARIRPGTKLADAVKIGDFVETKNALMGKGSKANHLAYIGDAEIGENVNIGAGTIFCNYDGANKHKSKLGDNVFVGSNSVLVAPVELANNSFVGAGSAVSKDVEADTLVVARARQKTITGWQRPVKDKK